MKPICKIENCEGLVRTRGWCSIHYWRWYRNDDPEKCRTPPGTGVKWLENLLKDKNDGLCRDWPFGVSNKNRATLGQGRLAAWKMLELMGFPKPHFDLDAMHSCDRPICVAPWHLSWGTRGQNMKDASERGRVKKGSENGYAKLTEEEVILIREMYEEGWKQKELANEFNVEQTNISAIVRRKTWIHV